MSDWFEQNAPAQGGSDWFANNAPANQHPSMGHVGDFMAGVGAGGIGTVLGAYELLRKIPGADKVLPPVSDEVRSYAEPPDTVSAKVGKFLEGTAEFAVPAGEVGAATKGAGLLARAAAQAGTAGAVRAAQTGGNLPKTADAAALGAAGPVAGAALQTVAPLARSVMQNAPGVAADVVGLASPRAAHAIRIAQRVANAAGKATEAAPAAATEDEQMLEAIARARQNAAAENAIPAPKFAARPPEHYGLKAAEAPPSNPTPSAPPSAQPPASAAPSVPTSMPKVQPIRPEPMPQPEAQPTPAPSRPTAAAAAKSARYADAIGKWARDHGMSVKAIAEQWGDASPETRGQIIMELKRGGYLEQWETIPNTSAPGIVQALKDRAQTIRPQPGFSMGAMRQ